jgi:hypothetical protein
MTARRPHSPKPGFLAAIAIPAMLIGSGLSAPAQASTYVVTLEQVGSNVVATGSGSIDTTALAFLTVDASSAGILPVGADISTGPVGVTSFDLYSGISGPTSFGPGDYTSNNSGAGAFVGVDGSAEELVLPVSYVSGTSLSETSTYDSATLAVLGVTPGTYEWTWGSGADAGSFTLDVGVVTPIPATFPLFAGGFGVISLLARRRKNKDGFCRRSVT